MNASLVTEHKGPLTASQSGILEIPLQRVFYGCNCFGVTIPQIKRFYWRTCFGFGIPKIKRSLLLYYNVILFISVTNLTNPLR